MPAYTVRLTERAGQIWIRLSPPAGMGVTSDCCVARHSDQDAAVSCGLIRLHELLTPARV